jgi:hypothetical protein
MGFVEGAVVENPFMYRASGDEDEPLSTALARGFDQLKRAKHVFLDKRCDLSLAAAELSARTPKSRMHDSLAPLHKCPRGIPLVQLSGDPRQTIFHLLEAASVASPAVPTTQGVAAANQLVCDVPTYEACCSGQSDLHALSPCESCERSLALTIFPQFSAPGNPERRLTPLSYSLSNSILTHARRVIVAAERQDALTKFHPPIVKLRVQGR